MAKLVLTKKIVLDFLSQHKFMAIATSGKFPWIAGVYYTFDKDLNIYFLSSPQTVHCQQINKNPKVAVYIADSHQQMSDQKVGLQISGIATEISGANKIKHALELWKKDLGVTNPKYSYENMIKKVITSRMYKISPKRIKLFDQNRFKVADGMEPVLEI